MFALTKNVAHNIQPYMQQSQLGMAERSDEKEGFWSDWGGGGGKGAGVVLTQLWMACWRLSPR